MHKEINYSQNKKMESIIKDIKGHTEIPTI